MSSDKEALPPKGVTRRSLLRAIGGGAAVGGLALASPRLAQASLTSGTEVVDVAIIGAGLSGLCAARSLVKAGCDSLVVLEARSRVGGRTYDHDLGNGIISEGGGQWIGPSQTAIAELADELGVKTFKTFYEGKTVFIAEDARVTQTHSDGGVHMDEGVTKKINDLAKTVPSGAPWTAPNAKELDKLSVGDWLAKQNLSLEDQLNFQATMTLTFGTTPSSLGFLHYLQMINSSQSDVAKLESMKGGAQESRFIGGSQLLSKIMAREIGDKLKLSTPVRKIVNWDKEIVEIHTDQGVVRARQVISALSPSLCNQINFMPALPEGREKLQRFWPAHSPMRKTVHVYSRPFWRDAGLNGQVVPIGSALTWAYDNSPPDASIGVLNAFIRPGQLSNDPEEAERFLTNIYVQAFGEKAAKPLQFHDHDWGKEDQWSQSCISPLPPGFWTKWGRYLKPSVGKIIWAGSEAADVWSGSMDGAVRAGQSAAREALKSLSQHQISR